MSDGWFQGKACAKQGPSHDADCLSSLVIAVKGVNVNVFSSSALPSLASTLATWVVQTAARAAQPAVLARQELESGGLRLVS